MSQGDRRTFLSETGTGIAGAAAIMSSLLSSRAQGANERVHVGLIGCGGRGIQVARTRSDPKTMQLFVMSVTLTALEPPRPKTTRERTRPSPICGVF